MNKTHSDLVEAAAAWLRKKCAVVITELTTTYETPDAIGWNGAHSTLIECKISRADFLADRHKPFRRDPEQGIGASRYYLAPRGLITVSDLPAGWGLLEIEGQRIRVTQKSGHFMGVNSRQEIRILLSTLRRVGHNAPKSVSIRCYTIENQNTATLHMKAPKDSPSRDEDFNAAQFDADCAEVDC